MAERRGTLLMASCIDLGVDGHVEQAFFVEGTGPSYAATPRPTRAPFRSRVLVRRPLEPQRFNGDRRGEPSIPTGSSVRALLRSGHAYTATPRGSRVCSR